MTALIVTLSLIGTVCYFLGWISPWVGWGFLVWIGVGLVLMIRDMGNKTGPAPPWYEWIPVLPILLIAFLFGHLNYLFQDLMKLP